ncbi:hypothetical protein BKA67DRAFT_537681 [Truncatella angustata]|uniref:Uncharacterized protein n=1 Tax=Truncatella angustata TaxID=152316 RepID=A0A9P8UGT1_9PEZI|nr:uncharacterized protein BKA67DRAFT_537681 [Truncatella angustata]KAH6651829.1 hypothetical protein BKA67DRAFT_537681 [Truncatella angustata]
MWAGSESETSPQAAGDAIAKLSIPNPNISHDRHDRNDPSALTLPQRQQRRSLIQTPPPRTSSLTPAQRSETPSSQHRLRRTPRFSATPSPKPAEPKRREPESAPAKVTVTLGPIGQYVLAGDQDKGKGKARVRPRPPPRKLSQDLSSEDNDEEDSPGSQHRRSRFDLPEPDAVLRISKRTHRAVLYTLEELLRGPHQLSSDFVEETASMADLMGGGIPTSNGNGGSSSRMPAARAPTGSPSGIRGPRMIMQERAAREARQREERERAERQHAAEEARLLEEANRREAERRAPAGAGGPEFRQNLPGGVDSNVSRRATTTRPSGRTGPEAEPRVGEPSRTAAVGASAQPSQRQTAAPHQTQQPSSADATAGHSQSQHLSTSDSVTAAGRGRNSFPHAFERWETLSAHWEGLTSFWIRKLKQNAEEINLDPVSQQLARNVSDLSSAGANLFHAVVELQRLRASSERKFQRWFFETRTEIERNQEVTALLEAALEEERRSRADAIREALEQEKGNSKTQKLLSEMRKELQISKEEARRAWDELGRREQEERDRTTSLQQGHPTIVGGVQVVPMTQGVSRHSSRRDQQPYAQGESDYGQTSSSRPEYSEAPAVQPVVASSSGAGAGTGASQQPPTTVHHQGSYGSEGAYSEGEYPVDARGRFVGDSRGNKMPFRAPASDGESDVGIDEFETPGAQPTTQYPTSTGAQPRPDYSGAGYSSSEWDTVGGARHHHPTRLSDVLEEEEERSRTSASQSQVSRV